MERLARAWRGNHDRTSEAVIISKSNMRTGNIGYNCINEASGRKEARNCFKNRVTDEWTKLSRNVTDKDNKEGFKCRLDRLTDGEGS